MATSIVRSFHLDATIVSFGAIQASFLAWSQIMVMLWLYHMRMGLISYLGYVGLVLRDEVLLEEEFLIVAEISLSFQLDSIKWWMTEACGGPPMDLVMMSS